MWRRALFVVIAMLAAFSLHAQAEEFVLSTNPETPAPNRPVRLRIDEFTRAPIFLPPVVERHGHLIVVHQTEIINSIVIIEIGIPSWWSTRTIDLGRLPEGDYVVILDQYVDDPAFRRQHLEFFDLSVHTTARPELRIQ